MGVDWIAHQTKEKRMESTHGLRKVFRAEALNDTALPESILKEIYVDKSPIQMDAFADDLLTELDRNENKYNEYDETMIENTVTWLRYWSEENARLHVWQ